MTEGRITGLRDGDLDLDATLASGQVFRWDRDAGGTWRGTVGARRMRLSQSADGAALYYAADGPEADAAVRAFLRLDDLDLPAAAQEWGAADPLFAEAWARQPGVRVLRQDPDECFFSFLCASVAPVARISRMVRAVAEEAGTKDDAGLLPFPPAAALAGVSEERLRDLGLGFRARRVVLAARDLASLPVSPLAILRGASLDAARAALCGFAGVGTKIADCIALFSLDCDEAVPIDTHIWRLARTRYAPELAGKSLTPANYDRAAQAFREHFGPKAGWAQQILFYQAAFGKLSPS